MQAISNHELAYPMGKGNRSIGTPQDTRKNQEHLVICDRNEIWTQTVYQVEL